MKTEPLHAIVFDKTSYYVISYREALELVKSNKNYSIVKTGNDLDFLSDVADELNEELYK